MDSPKLRNLLFLYFHGKLNKTQFEELSSLLECYTDNEIGDELEYIWRNESISSSTLSPNVKAQILNSLHQRMNKSYKPKLYHWQYWKIAVAAAVIIVVGVSLWVATYPTHHPEQQYTVLAAKGERSQIILPDGTKVWLNSGSSISYGSAYNQENRNISLNGEAYFDVEKNPNLPFDVNLGAIKVQVLGTAFNVSSYKEDSTLSVTLERGSVELKNQGTDKAIGKLVPGEKATFNKSNKQLAITNCDATADGLWRNNILKFEDARASEVMRKLGKWYGVNIITKNMKSDLRYGFTIKGESLKEMLDLVNVITPIKYSINGEEVTIIYK